MDAEEGLNSDFDLNSLIEGHVDKDDLGEEFVTALEGPDEKEKAASVVTFLEPLTVGVTPCTTLTVGCFFLSEPDWVNPSKRGGMDRVFRGLAGLLRGIS